MEDKKIDDDLKSLIQKYIQNNIEIKISRKNQRSQ